MQWEYAQVATDNYPYLWYSHRRKEETIKALEEGGNIVRVGTLIRHLGDEGWELVAVTSGPGGENLYFKRPR